MYTPLQLSNRRLRIHLPKGGDCALSGWCPEPNQFPVPFEEALQQRAELLLRNGCKAHFSKEDGIGGHGAKDQLPLWGCRGFKSGEMPPRRFFIGNQQGRRDRDLCF